MSAEFVSFGWGFEADARRYAGTLFPQLQVRVEFARVRTLELYRTDASGPAAEVLHQLRAVERLPWRQKSAAAETVELETPWLTPRALEAYLIFTYPQWFRLAA